MLTNFFFVNLQLLKRKIMPIYGLCSEKKVLPSYSQIELLSLMVFLYLQTAQTCDIYCLLAYKQNKYKTMTR